MKPLWIVISLIISLLFINVLLLLTNSPKSNKFFLNKTTQDFTIGNYLESEAWKLYIKSLNLETNFHKILADDDYCDRVKEYRKKNPIRLDSKGLPLPDYKVIYSNYPN